MFQYFFFCFVLALTLLDLFLLQAHFTLMGLFYVLLKVQADISAANLVAGKIKNKKAVEIPAEDYFAQVRIPEEYLTHKISSNEPTKVSSRHEVPKIDIPKKPETKKTFQLPKFHGTPHEVLRIDENAITKVIHKAFRHWIKRYHPDHQKSEVNQKATVQARKLQEAKEQMLEKRQNSRIAKAA